MKELVRWLRKKRIGTSVRLREFIVTLLRPIGILPISASLSLRVFRGSGVVEDLGVVSTHEVTDDFVAALVDTLQASVAAFSNFKYHDSGTGVGAEDPTDSALGTPCGEARDTGTQVEGATANIYKSVATHTYAGSFAITEHGLFNAAAVGVLMDRSVFTAVNITLGDRIEFTYQLTCVSGG